MKDIGKQLREAREKKKLSIQDVSIAIKINNKTLQAIEDGDLESLPAKPFLRGFVQTYARYLELNVDDIMKKFLEIAGSTKPKPQITEEGGSAQDNHEEVQNKFEMYKKIAYTVAAIIAVVCIYFIQKVVSKYEQESKIAKEQKEAVKSQIPVEGIPEQAATTTDTTTTASTVDAAAPTTPATTTPEVKTEEKKPEVKVEAPKVEVKPVTPPLVTAPAAPPTKPATPAPAAVATPTATTPTPAKPEEKKPEVKAEAPKVEEKKPEEKKAAALKPQQIIIEALDNVEVKYSKDGESERTVKLKPEQFLTIKADSKINLNVSDSGAVNIIHNGRDKGVPGNLGQPTKITYP